MFRRRIVSVVATASLLVGVGAAAPAIASTPTTDLNVRDITGISALVETSSDTRIANWQNLQFGLFMHWGAYSMFEGKYNGKPQHMGYPEQIKAWENIPRETYLQEAAKMTADKWDAAKICKTAKDAGMKYVMITSKHHDGFAMWDTKTTDYNIVKQTPFGKDPLKQLSEECAKIDMKLAFYFSIIDWEQHEPEPWANQNPISDEHLQYNLDQITELLTGYGPIAEFWFDMGGPTAEQSEKMAAKVHELQPDTTVVNSRVWNNKGDFNVGGDNAVHSTFSMGPWESIRSIFPACWSYCSDWRADRDASRIIPEAKKAINDLVKVIANDGNFAFNIGPRGDGSFDPFDQAVLDELIAWHTRHPNAIDGARSTWFPNPDWGFITGKGNSLYLFPDEWKDGAELSIRGLNNTVVSAVVDGTDTALDVKRIGLDLTVTLKGDNPDTIRPVARIDLDSAPMIVPTQTVVLANANATITAQDIIGREIGADHRNALVDAYIVDRTGTSYGDVEFDLTDATGISDSTKYELSFGDKSIVVTGAELKAGSLSGFTLAANQVERLRIRLAEPTYYTDPLGITFSTIKVAAYKDSLSQVAPEFKSHPESTSISEGQNVTFTAMASGRPHPTYQWFAIGADGVKKAIEGAISASYGFVATKDLDQTRYVVEATNSVGKAVSNEAVLTVTDPNANLALNKSARQSSEGWWGGDASRANDGNTDGVWNNNSVSGTQNQKDPWWEVDLDAPHEIGKVNVYNRAESDDCSGTSCAKRLHDFYVVADADPIPDDIPVDVLETEAQSGDESTSSMRVIKVEGEGGYPSTVDFKGHEARYIRVVLPGDAVELNLAEVEVFQAMSMPTVKISATGAADSGFEHRDGKATTRSGTEIIFTASATGFPAPAFQWQKKGQGEWNDIDGETSQSYTMTTEATDDGSLIRVVATNTLGKAASESIELVIVDKPTVSSITASVNGAVVEPADDGAWQKVTVDEGTSVTLAASVTGHPEPAMTWQSRPISGNEDQWSDIADQTGTSMTVTASSEVQKLLYRLVAKNAAGTVESAPLRIAVTEKITPTPPSPEPRPELKIELDSNVFKVGDELVATVTGLSAGENVTATIHSDPLVIGRAVATNDGTASFKWRIPTEFSVGTHRLVIRGDKSGSVERSLEIQEAQIASTPHVTPTPGAEKSQTGSVHKTLASTGSDILPIAEVSGLVAFIGAVALIGRRRRS